MALSISSIKNRIVPKGNLINRKYKAHKIYCNFLCGVGVAQNVYEFGAMSLGKSFNPANFTIGISNIILGVANKCAMSNLRSDYLKILERAKKLRLNK